VAFALWSGTSTATVSVSVQAEVPAPGKPASLSCSSSTFTGSNVNVTWGAAANSTSYGLAVKNSAGNYLDFTPGSITGTSASFNAAALSDGNGPPYRVRVRAINGSTPGPLSDNAFVITFGNSSTRSCSVGSP
jgi:hypothetical protein